MKFHCPSCGEAACPPTGKSKDLLIVGSAPSQADMQTGIPFSTHEWYMTEGKILRKRLEILGAPLSLFRTTHLWLHNPNNNESCYQAGYNNVLDEAKGKKAILLVGADAVDAFTKYKVSDVSGLQVDSHILSAPIIYAMISPGLALHRSYGEIHLALSNFVTRLESGGLL